MEFIGSVTMPLDERPGLSSDGKGSFKEEHMRHLRRIGLVGILGFLQGCNEFIAPVERTAMTHDVVGEHVDTTSESLPSTEILGSGTAATEISAAESDSRPSLTDSDSAANDANVSEPLSETQDVLGGIGSEKSEPLKTTGRVTEKR